MHSSFVSFIYPRFSLSGPPYIRIVITGELYLSAYVLCGWSIIKIYLMDSRSALNPLWSTEPEYIFNLNYFLVKHDSTNHDG